MRPGAKRRDHIRSIQIAGVTAMAARLRRLLGELLPALWAEGMRRRVDGTVGSLDSFARAAPPDVAARWAARSRR